MSRKMARGVVLTMIILILGLFPALIPVAPASTRSASYGGSAPLGSTTGPAALAANTGRTYLPLIFGGPLPPTATPTPPPSPTPVPTATPTSTPTPPCGPKQTLGPFGLGPSSRFPIYQNQLDPSHWVYFWISAYGSGEGYDFWGDDHFGTEIYGPYFQTGLLPAFEPPYSDSFTFWFENTSLFDNGTYIFTSELCNAGTGP